MQARKRGLFWFWIEQILTSEAPFLKAEIMVPSLKRGAFLEEHGQPNNIRKKKKEPLCYFMLALFFSISFTEVYCNYVYLEERNHYFPDVLFQLC